MRQGEERASQEQQLCEKPEETFLDPTGPEEDKEEVSFLTLWWGVGGGLNHCHSKKKKSGNPSNFKIKYKTTKARMFRNKVNFI